MEKAVSGLCSDQNAVATPAVPTGRNAAAGVGGGIESGGACGYSPGSPIGLEVRGGKLIKDEL